MVVSITYIDHVTKKLFNGSRLGKQYSVKAIEERCSLNFTNEVKKELQSQKLQKIKSSQNKIIFFKSKNSNFKYYLKQKMLLIL